MCPSDPATAPDAPSGLPNQDTPPSDPPAPGAPGAQIPEDRRRIEALLSVMADLRHPDHGCAWDREQTFNTIAPYTIEEAYEVADAIREQDTVGIKDELGDLLLQVVFHSAIAQDQGAFTFADVVEAICDKMIRRHPHVFGSHAERAGGPVHGTWEAQKAEERAASAARRGQDISGVLDDVPLALPALLRSEKLQKRVARVGFDWDDADGVLAKVVEEAGELAEEVEQGGTQARIAEEYGDLLFVMVSLGRKLGLDAETALRDANAKFERRFRAMERFARERGSEIATGSVPPETLDDLWQLAKREEKAGD